MYIYILLFFISIIICSPPPIPEPEYEPLVFNNFVPKKLNYKDSSLKNLQENVARQITQFNKAVRTYLENGYEEDHELKMSTINLDEGYYFSYYPVPFKKVEGQSFFYISSSCEVKKISDDAASDHTCISGLFTDTERNFYNITFNYTLTNDEYIVFKYKYKITKEKKDILYRQESIIIPRDDNTEAFCDFKYVIPEGYANLGLTNDILTKESENTFIYNDKCTNTGEPDKKDVIRFTPKISYWKAMVGFYLESSSPIDKNLSLTFPIFYKGGKIRNNNYKIITYENKILEESELIHDEIFLKAELPGKNNKEIGLNIYTTFSNKLSDDFNLYAENVYQLDTNIDDVLKNKALGLINDGDSVFEKFKKIGKFIYSHITYDLNYLGRNLTALEIYNGQRGVCEHYTILYNAMLNAIGIKTIKIFGWSFDKDRTSATEKTVGHAWTGALNEDTGKIVELDATWNLFEGIPSGHILKGFNQEIVYHPTAYDYFKTHNIQLVESLDGSEDHIVYEGRIKDVPTVSVTNINNGGNEEGKGNKDGKGNEDRNDEKGKDGEKTDAKDNGGNDKNIKKVLIFISLLFLLL